METHWLGKFANPVNVQVLSTITLPLAALIPEVSFDVSAAKATPVLCVTDVIMDFLVTNDLAVFRVNAIH